MNFMGVDDENYESIVQMLKSAQNNKWDFNPLQEEAKALYDAHRALLKKWINVRIGLTDVDLYSADPQRLVPLFKQLEKVANGEARTTFSPDDVDFLISDHLKLRDTLSMLSYGMPAEKFIAFQKARDEMMDKIIKNGGDPFGGSGEDEEG